MSRIGKQPIPVPEGVDRRDRARARARQRARRASSPSASAATSRVEQEDGELVVTRPTDRGEHRALHGLTRSLVANMVIGVTDGYAKRSRSRASATAPS